MGSYTDITRRWLDRRFQETRGGIYIPHQPIYGLNNPNQQEVHAPIFARTFQILRLLNGLQFETMLEVGGGEGFLAHVVRESFGARVMSTDLSIQACLRAREIFGLDSAAVNAASLPFEDGAFDVVVCSEVVEHVEYPVELLLEVARVARLALIVTTDDVLDTEPERDAELFERCGLPHLETCMFVAEDFDAVYGECDAVWHHFRPPIPAEPIAVADALAWIEETVQDPGLAEDALGIALLKVKDASARRPEPHHDERELLERLVETRVAETAPRAGPHAGGTEPLALTREKVVCPVDRGPLAADEGGLLSETGRSYPVVHGVPDLVTLPSAAVSADEAGRRIAAHFPDDAGRRDALVALRAKLTLPSFAGKESWDFGVHEDRRGWKRNDELVERPGDGVAFHWRSKGGDPWVVGPRLDVEPATLEAVEIRMRIHNPAFRRDEGVGQLYWLAADQLGFTEDASVHFPVVNDGEVHTYRVELGEAPGWPRDGLVLNMRIDPMNGPGDVDLLSFELCRR